MTPERATDTCYYDGLCGFCTRSVRILRALDWLGRLEFKDMTRVPPQELPVPMERAMEGMPMRTRNGRVHVGFPAVRRALVQTPLGLIPAALLYIPLISTLGRLVYNIIARNRVRQCVLPDQESPVDPNPPEPREV